MRGLAAAAVVHAGRLTLGLRGAPNRAPALPRPHSGRLQKKKTQAANLRDAPGVIPADKQPPKEVSAMAEVHIRNLKCVQRQDGSSLFRVGGSGEPPAAGAVEGR